jgi:hypothetical protein
MPKVIICQGPPGKTITRVTITIAMVGTIKLIIGKITTTIMVTAWESLLQRISASTQTKRRTTRTGRHGNNKTRKPPITMDGDPNRHRRISGISRTIIISGREVTKTLISHSNSSISIIHGRITISNKT